MIKIVLLSANFEITMFFWRRKIRRVNIGSIFIPLITFGAF